MPLAGAAAASAALLLSLLLVLGAAPSCHGAPSHDITAILANRSDFTEFSAALASTGAAALINGRATITVLAVNNTVMAQLKALQLQPKELAHVIYLHVLLDYFDAAKFSSIRGGSVQATSLYQASGDAQGSAGIVNITLLRGGAVGFALSGPTNAPPPAAFYERSIHEAPYDIAVLQVSALIWSPAPVAAAQAPAPPPDAAAAPGLTDLLSKNGCAGFSGLLAATADASATYARSAGGDAGLTIFCPADEAVAAFNPTFKNLSADDQLALLLYHGVAAHYSEQSLKAINGGVSTLATDGSKNQKYNLTVSADGDTVKLSSASPTAAKVMKTVVDKAPLAVYLIDAVLLPKELSNGGHGRTAPAPAPASSPPHAHTPTPAPAAPVSSPPAHAPAPAAAPGTPTTPRRRPAAAPEDAPAPSPDADSQAPSDQKNNGARATTPAAWSLGVAAVAAVAAIVLLLW